MSAACTDRHDHRLLFNATSFGRLLLAALLISSCGDADSSDASGTASADTSRAAAEIRARAQTPAPPLIPATAGLDRVLDLVFDPAKDTAGDPHMRAMVQRGYDIFRETKKNAPAYVGNSLACANCHLNAGQKEAAWPLVGVAGLFPQYRSRGGKLITLEDRIRDCFMRSMNGTAPAFGSEELVAVSAYIARISKGQSVGVSPPWRSRNEIPAAKRIAIDHLDPALGRTLFEKNCVACHGTDGQGGVLSSVHPGPLWGPESWNDGAGAARVYTLAGYIRYAMPLTAPGTLTDEDAQQIAAYINSQPRPSYASKSVDYPGGDIPVDAVYYTSKYPAHPLRK